MGRSARSSAIAEWVARHYERVYRYAYRLAGSAGDAEDLTQETFVKAQERLAQLRDPERAAGWLLAIARNLFLQKRRQEQRARELPMESLEELSDDAETAWLADDLDPEALQAALLELPEEFRTALVLFYFEELPYKEIAEALGVPIGTVMSRLARGKAHLRRRLTQAAETPPARAVPDAVPGAVPALRRPD